MKKRTLPLFVVCCLVLCMLAPIAAAAQAPADVYEVQTVRVGKYTGLRFFSGELMTLDIPAWLQQIMPEIVLPDAPQLGGNTAEAESEEDVSPDAGDPAEPDSSEEEPMTNYSEAPTPNYTPELLTPYEVLTTKSYFDSKGDLCYKLMLRAVYIDTAYASVCVKKTAWYQIRSGSWQITAGEPQYKNGKATVDFTVTQLFTGVPVSTRTVTLTAAPGDRSNKSYVSGDADMDGRVSAADARLVLRAAVRLEPAGDLLTLLADMDRDSIITAADARLVLRLSVATDGAA